MTTAQIVGTVRAELARARVSHREMARRLGWPNGLLARRLSGEVEFSASELAAIAEQLSVPVGRFYETPRDPAIADAG